MTQLERFNPLTNSGQYTTKETEMALYVKFNPLTNSGQYTTEEFCKEQKM